MKMVMLVLINMVAGPWLAPRHIEKAAKVKMMMLVLMMMLADP